MLNLTIANLFGDISRLEAATGQEAITINIITLAVLITLCLCDVLIASCGCLFCCCMCYRNRSKNNNSYQLNNVQRSSITYPKISRLSRVSSSTAGGVEMEWVETQRYSQSSDIPLHQSTAKVSMQSQSYANKYPHLSNEDNQTRMSAASGYMVMNSMKNPGNSIDMNYDSVVDTQPNFYEDVLNAVPNLHPDRDTYDDVMNVRLGGEYDDVLNYRNDPSRDKLF